MPLDTGDWSLPVREAGKALIDDRDLGALAGDAGRVRSGSRARAHLFAGHVVGHALERCPHELDGAAVRERAERRLRDERLDQPAVGGLDAASKPNDGGAGGCGPGGLDLDLHLAAPDGRAKCSHRSICL